MDDEPVFACYVCDFTSSRKPDYVRHMSTKKHLESIKLCKTKPNKTQCDCGKSYSHSSGLSRHKAVCPVHLMIQLDEEYENSNNRVQTSSDDDNVSQNPSNIEKTVNSETHANTNPITQQATSDGDIKVLLTDIAQQLREMKEAQALQQQQITNNNNINNNYILNLNMFLNENCKDALSLQDFVKQITFVFDDLKDKTWRSRVLLNNLGSLQLENRPFHCVDTTTCQVVLKNGGQWQEGNKDDIVSTLDSCGKHVQKQFGPQWDSQYPDWTSSEQHSRRYMDLLCNITREPTPSQVAEELRSISKSTSLENTKTISPLAKRKPPVIKQR